MNTRGLAAALALSMVVLVICMLRGATAQVLTPKAEDVRFELVSHEPVAAPDNRSVAAGWWATVLKDRRTGKCFVAVTEGDSVSLAPIECR